MSIEFSDDKNQRRCELIDKEISGVIFASEASELEMLQREMLAYRREVAPLPLDDMRSFYKQLLAASVLKDQ